MKKIIITFVVLCFSAAVFGAEKTAKDYIKDLDASKDALIITKAADWLAKEKEKDAVPKLIPLLKDSREDVRIHAVMALGYIRDDSEKVLNSIHDLMLNDSSSNVRYAAVLSSFRIGSKKSVDAWKQVNEKESDPFIKDFIKKMIEKAKK